jgi:thymidylate synthase (FAD)
MRLSAEEDDLQRRARDAYADRIAAGVAREQARKELPLSTYTEAYWKIDLQNLLHFLQLRMDAHAQQEIRAYATVIGERIVARWVPVAWEAFLDYRRHAVQLSRFEAEMVVALASGRPERATAIAGERGMLARGEDGRLKANFERREVEDRLLELGWTAPWLEQA